LIAAVMGTAAIKAVCERVEGWGAMAELLKD